MAILVIVSSVIGFTIAAVAFPDTAERERALASCIITVNSVIPFVIQAALQWMDNVQN